MGIFGGFVDFRVIYIFARCVVGILVGKGPMFSHAQRHFMVFTSAFRAVFIFNSAAAISKVVKKAKQRLSGWGPESSISMHMRATSLFFEAFGMVGPGVGTGSISAIVGFCSCLSLFMDIGRISESVEFAPLLQLIQGRVRSARTLVDCRKHFPRRPNAGRGGIDGPPPHRLVITEATF